MEGSQIRYPSAFPFFSIQRRKPVVMRTFLKKKKKKIFLTIPNFSVSSPNP
jgi:hypothetical protein